jgi:Putative zinc-finger
MDHAEAARTAAIDKYLLGDLPDAQREDFEEHFFSCPECAGEVRLGAVFQANARAVLKDAGSLAAIPPARQGWFSGDAFAWSWRPAFAMAGGLAMGALIGYQNLVQIPQLRRQSEFTVSAKAEVRGVRGAGDLSFSRRNGPIALEVTHEWEETYGGYAVELVRRPASKVVRTASIGPAAGNFEITILPAGLESGNYLVTVYGVRAGGQKTPVERFPLTLTD